MCTAAMTPPPVVFDKDPLRDYWERPVYELATTTQPVFTPQEKERRTIYSLTLMSLLEHYWNGNVEGMRGTYPWREKQQWPNQQNLYLSKPPSVGKPLMLPSDYAGHNIGALAVDVNGLIIDFDFNHNALFSSSMQHAETRLMRRLLELANLSDELKSIHELNSETDKAAQPADFNHVPPPLDVTIYTSLESCAQCSGAMTLGGVKEVVYLEKDFGTFCIGDILYNLTHNPDGSTNGVVAPRPTPAAAFDLPEYEQLNDAFKTFYAETKAKPFFTSSTGANRATRGVAAFLCTDAAYAIYAAAAARFSALPLKYPDYKPSAESRTNREVLANAKTFLAYAITARRGTPHGS